MIKSLLSLFLLQVAFICGAAEVKPFDLESKIAGKTFPVIVILPDSYKTNTSKKYVVTYLLHGVRNSPTTWAYPGIKEPTPQSKSITMEMADRHDVIFVCATGGPNSWYSGKPEEYIIKELIPHIDANYRTDTNHRWVSGFSMGGFGSLRFGIKYPKIFTSFIAISPCTNPTNWDKWGIQKILGKDYKKVFTPKRMEALKQDKRHFGIIVGTKDFFYPECEETHHELTAAGIPHLWKPVEGEKHKVVFSVEIALPIVMNSFFKHNF